MSPRIDLQTAIDEGWYKPNERDGYCYCGCGEKTNIVKRSDRRFGLLIGQHVRYIKNHDKRYGEAEALNSNWYKLNTNNGLCHCGCRQLAPIASKSNKQQGAIRGEALRYIIGHSGCKQGRIKCKQGYLHLRAIDHPYYRKSSRMPMHRLVVENHLRRYLNPNKEVVHHCDENKTNNNIDNLMLFSSNSKHIYHHAKLKKMYDKYPNMKLIKTGRIMPFSPCQYKPIEGLEDYPSEVEYTIDKTPAP